MEHAVQVGEAEIWLSRKSWGRSGVTGAMAETMREKFAMAASSFIMFGENFSITRYPTSRSCFDSSRDPSSRTVKASSYAIVGEGHLVMHAALDVAVEPLALGAQQ